jgi:anti-sigma regulatory factor (Ser/Thr protein kinase)
MAGQHGGALPEEDIAALPEAGRGFEIMRACVDNVSMTSGPEHRTVVSLQKRLAWRPGAPFADEPDDELADAG